MPNPDKIKIQNYKLKQVVLFFSMSKTTIRKRFEKPKSTIKKELPSRSRVMCFVNHEYKVSVVMASLVLI